MTTHVGTTPRKALTPTQRLKMFENHKGICCLCKLPIQVGQKWIDEHIRPLALGGTNDLTNRGPAHVACATDKTVADMAAITKAKRQKIAAIGAKAAPAKTITSAGFPRSSKRQVHPMPALPPRRMFVEVDQ
jgi:5-methylcytosine-specific restriction endonuclease McrA